MDSKVLIKFTILIIIINLTLGDLLDLSFSVLSFKRGRRSGGNLGDPFCSEDIRDDLANYTVVDYWFNQKLDHLDSNSNITWQQRYYVNSVFYQPGGPVFLMIGAEGAASPLWMSGGAWIHYAKEYNAFCIMLEHRFYGMSQPTPDLSVESLAYLTSEQAIYDLAHFMSSMQNIQNWTGIGVNLKYAPWVAFGGSYSGALAVWLREKHADLIYGSISSSGPILAKAYFYEYFDVVKNALETYSSDCVNEISNAFNEINQRLNTSDGRDYLTKRFKLCTPLENSIDIQLDISNFYEHIANGIAGIVQYSKPSYETTSLNIDSICKIMTNMTTKSAVKRLSKITRNNLKRENITCLDFSYHDQIKSLSSTSWNSSDAEGARQWFYQTCNEFGFFTIHANNSLFGDVVPIDFFIQQCIDIFGPTFNLTYLEQSVEATNNMYGGMNPNSTNVLFVHGSLDPWHALGQINSSDWSSPSIYINGTSHCEDMYAPTVNDSIQLKAARAMTTSFIHNIINVNDQIYYLDVD